MESRLIPFMPGMALLGCLASIASAAEGGSVKLVTLDPGHFHAALVQKSMYRQVDPVVHVYAPAGDDVTEHLKRIQGYNTRAENPTRWEEVLHVGPDYFEKAIGDRSGNVLVLSGNNGRKTEYLRAGVDAGYHVLADKPMAIDMANFELLRHAFESAQRNNVLLYDIMTERFEITCLLQREFSQLREVFGELEKGTADDPAVTKESVHYFYKHVSGSVLKRPPWFFDARQQGDGIVDITTHLVDLVQWACFPGRSLDYVRDIQIVSARHWPTPLTTGEFKAVTQLGEIPGYLDKDRQGDVLQVYANGEINYRLRGIAAKVSVIWHFRAPEGAGDTHYSVMRGTRANLIIRQGAEQGYKPVLYIEPAAGADPAALERGLRENLSLIQRKFSGIDLKDLGQSWQVLVPAEYHVGHEAHFAQVMENFLGYIAAGRLPEWEVPNMLAKYYTTARALQVARGQ